MCELVFELSLERKLMVAQISKLEYLNQTGPFNWWVRQVSAEWGHSIYWRTNSPFCLIIMIKSAKMVAILIKYSLLVKLLDWRFYLLAPNIKH